MVYIHGDSTIRGGPGGRMIAIYYTRDVHENGIRITGSLQTMISPQWSETRVITGTNIIFDVFSEDSRKRRF